MTLDPGTKLQDLMAAGTVYAVRRQGVGPSDNPNPEWLYVDTSRLPWPASVPPVPYPQITSFGWKHLPAAVWYTARLWPVDGQLGHDGGDCFRCNLDPVH